LDMVPDEGEPQAGAPAAIPCFKLDRLTAGLITGVRTKSGMELRIRTGPLTASRYRLNAEGACFYYEAEVGIFIDGAWASYNQLKARGVFAFLGTEGEYEVVDDEERDRACALILSYIPVEKLAGLIRDF
jgi:hypothetical protein